MLIATSWSDYGPRTPLLLSDFSQVYYICDDYIMLSRQDHWFGIIQRISTGFELFFLQGMLHSTGPRQSSPRKFVRVKSWPYENDLPDDIRSVVIAYMLQDPTFRSTLQNNIQLWNKSSSTALDDSATTPTQQWGVYKALHDMTNSFEKRRGNWRNIKPAPTLPTFE